MAEMIALGLMSGTSMDGIDLALLRTDGVTVSEAGPTGFVAYDASFRRRIEASLEVARSIARREERPGELADLERDITLRHAEAVRSFLAGVGAAWREPDVVGFHGQTVLHRPQAGLTVQLGDGELLASETGLPVVFDMRAADMKAGGQGAPLIPAYHAALARSLPGAHAGTAPVVFVNVGGISNITFVPRDGDPIAFDSGPGNALIDQWVSREAGVPFDADGAIASEGSIDADRVALCLASPFFARSGPKSLDRSDFTLACAEGLSLADGARTLAAVSAAAILKAAEHLPERPHRWIVAGGGRRNPHIMADLRAGALEQGADAILAEEVELDGDALEAQAWAFLAVRSLARLPLTFPTTTGCRSPVIGGVFATPRR